MRLRNERIDYDEQVPKVRVPATQETSEWASAHSREDRFPPPEIPVMEVP